MSISKYTCGETPLSGCVLFTGELPTFIPESSITCIRTLDEILAAHADQIQLLLASNDFKLLDKKCYSFNPLSVTAKQLHQAHIDKNCELSAALAALTLRLDNLNILEEVVDFDMGCLTPAASPCAQGTNLYTILSILTVFKNEICNIKAQL